MAIVTPSKNKVASAFMVSPTTIALAFPAEAVAELNDFAWRETETLKDRGIAQQILYALKGNRDIDVKSDKFNNMLDFLVLKIDSYSEQDNENFKAYIRGAL